MGRGDERLAPAHASHLLDNLLLYRCSKCRLARVEPIALRLIGHCDGGTWLLVVEPLARSVLMRFLSREMLRGRAPKG